MLDFPSLLYKGLRILMFQLSGVYCKAIGCGIGFRVQALVFRVQGCSGFRVQGCLGFRVQGFRFRDV